jgi:hypothetical protein
MGWDFFGEKCLSKEFGEEFGAQLYFALVLAVLLSYPIAAQQTPPSPLSRYLLTDFPQICGSTRIGATGLSDITAAMNWSVCFENSKNLAANPGGDRDDRAFGGTGLQRT